MEFAYTDTTDGKRIVSLLMRRPDDMHLHVRDGEAMADIVGHTTRQFGRAIIMPNLKPAVKTVGEAWAYKRRIENALRERYHHLPFRALMTLYLTEATSPKDICDAKQSGIVHGIKLYPANATTNSKEGVQNIESVYPVLEEMQRVDLPLLIHGEVTDPNIDVFDREAVFITQVFLNLRKKFPDLQMTLEHVTTEEGVELVVSEAAAGRRTGATITAHHLLENRNALFRGGIRPHYYCLPPPKRERHRQALLRAATSGNPAFFLGTDSAPHPRELKEHSCGCAGCFTALHALELYATAFESVNKLDALEAFASEYGADFYGLPRNSETVTLRREEWVIPKDVAFGKSVVVPFRAEETLHWKLVCA